MSIITRLRSSQNSLIDRLRELPVYREELVFPQKQEELKEPPIFDEIRRLKENNKPLNKVLKAINLSDITEKAQAAEFARTLYGERDFKTTEKREGLAKITEIKRLTPIEKPSEKLPKIKYDEGKKPYIYYKGDVMDILSGNIDRQKKAINAGWDEGLAQIFAKSIVGQAIKLFKLEEK